jgi:predicted ATPase
LLRAGEGVRVLATSRVALGIGGELAWRVPSLRAPDLHQPVAVDELAAYEAVRLLVDRARLARPGFKLTAGNAEAVRQICARLDGIPLALELAAARLGALSAEEIAGRLDDCFRLLTGGGQTVLPRHRTLRASIDWSHQLLTEPERILMRRLSVFAGGWTLASAEAVCGDQGGRDPAQLAAAGGLPASGVLEALAGLVDKSLAVMAEAGGVSRYTMSESIRQYAQERLRAGGEDERLRARHAAHFMELAESACSEPGGHSYALFRRLEWEHANVRAALAWCWSASGDPIVGLRLAAAAAWVWTFRRWLSMAPTAWPEMRGLLEEALAKAPDAPTAVRVEAIECLADLLLHLGEAVRAAKLYEEALAWRRQNAGARKLAATLEALANTLVAAAPHDRAALTRAVALYQESLDLYRELGATPQVESALAYLGYLWMSLGEFRQAFPLLDEALTGWRALGVKWSPEGGVARTTLWLGRTLYALGDMARSQALIEESLALYREIQDKNGVGWAQVYLGDLALMRGNARLAARRYRSALTMLGAIDDRPGMAAALAGLFETCRAQGRFLLAARLIGAAAAIGAGAAEMAGRSERLCYDRSIAAARALLDAPGFAAAWAQGQAMSVEQAAACAEEASQPLASRLS